VAALREARPHGRDDAGPASPRPEETVGGEDEGDVALGKVAVVDGTHHDEDHDHVDRETDEQRDHDRARDRLAGGDDLLGRDRDEVEPTNDT
jgi:hypothetical protein